MKKFKYYFKIWLLMAKNELLKWSVNRGVLLVFLIGKIVRYIAYFTFLYYLVKETNGLLGYTQSQALFFTATYVLVDTVSQFFFRSVYSFRPLVVSGDLDLVLVKPINSLFRVLMGGPDPIDLVTLPPIFAVVYWIGSTLNVTSLQTFFYVILIVNAIIIASAFHIVVLGLGIITLSVDHTIMVYRDLSAMGRFPVDIYKEPLKSILTFIVPIGVMVTVPGKVMAGIVHPAGVLLSIFFGISLFVGSLRFWRFALRHYTSASS